jgi:hypothetical protein
MQLVKALSCAKMYCLKSIFVGIDREARLLSSYYSSFSDF